MHPTAASGFSKGADAYAAHRPSYPAEVIDLIIGRLGLRDGSRVVDLAAGTGLSTALLVARGLEVVAVEPVEAMRTRCAALLPDVEMVDGTAERMPLPDSSADAVTVFQAFHWFDDAAALAEIHRVLRPGGGLALVWNVRDRSEPWVAEMAEMMEAEVGPLPYEQHHVNVAEAHWAQRIAEAGGFTTVETRAFPYLQDATVETIVGRAASTSFVAALDDDRRHDLLARIRALVTGHPDLAGRERFPFPHLTHVHWCLRI